MTEPSRAQALIAGASLREKGHFYEAFAVGQVFRHHWGRTVTEADTLLFTTLTCNSNPLYFNREYARAHGHRDLVVNPLLVFNTVLGLSVEDLSEVGGPFVGIDALVYGVAVYPGDTLRAQSETSAVRLSRSNPDNGLVTWRTRGFNQRDEQVVEFVRTNIVRKRDAREHFV